MQTFIKRIFFVVALMLAVCVAGGSWLYYRFPRTQRVFHHELAAAADPSLGVTEIPADHLVDESFVSHLPLIVIDTGEEELIHYDKVMDVASDAYLDPPGVELYNHITLSLIDNTSHVNSLRDTPATESKATLKIRGNYSASWHFPKKQFSIRLLDADGDENPLPLLGMDSSNEWILNASAVDGSYMRNYLAMNMGALLFDYTPDMRFCEVLVKKNNHYEYHGLYILYETVGRGAGKIDISRYDPSDPYHSYILRRDRYEEGETMLRTYGLENGYYTSWFEVQYPGKTRITQETVNQIQEEINVIERALYADNYESFLQYRNYLDIDSFVDYFVVNELFGNYDAGLHSTYLCKEVGGKLAMAALWDYDMGLDNWGDGLFDIDFAAFGDRPWFDRLLLDDQFVERVNRRYHNLRKTIYTDETMISFIQDTERFLGNAVHRDQSRWADEYTSPIIDVEDGKTGLIIRRLKNTHREETQRLEDTLILHAHYLDKNIQYIGETTASIQGVELSRSQSRHLELIAVLFFAAFFLSVILVQRHR